MKTLTEIKNEVAGSVGFESWKFAYRHDEITNWMTDEVAKRYAQQACEGLRERIAENATYDTIDKGDMCYEIVIDKCSILNTEIILP